MTLPKGRIPNETLQYCVSEAGGTIESFLDENDQKSLALTLGAYGFSAKTNRELLENVFSFVVNLPKTNGTEVEQ